MRLRDHPLMSRRGISNWPPVWLTLSGEREKGLGENGRLAEVLRHNLLNDKCFLVIEYKTSRYMGCLMFDDPAFCSTIYSLLQSCIGRSIKEIGDLDHFPPSGENPWKAKVGILSPPDSSGVPSAVVGIAGDGFKSEAEARDYVLRAAKNRVDEIVIAKARIELYAYKRGSIGRRGQLKN